MSKETGGPAFPFPSGPEPRVNEFHDRWEGMTLRQYAAIKLRVPDSGTDWLDEMIRRSQRDELAKAALSWALTENMPYDECARYAYNAAYAMLAEGNKP